MKLKEMLKRVKILAKEAFGIDVVQNGTNYAATKVNAVMSDEQHEAIIIKQNKGSVLLKCWGDGKETWVKKGSHCHVTGLCSACILEGLAGEIHA